jgi:hypothetical protein
MAKIFRPLGILELIFPMFIFRKVHGYFAFNGASQAIGGTNNTYAHVTNAGTDLFEEIQSNAGIDLIDDTFKFNPSSAPADSHGHMTIAFKLYGNGGNNKNFQARIYNVTQAEEVPVTAFANTEGGSNYSMLSGRAYCKNCNPDDIYRLELRPLSGNDNFTVIEGSVWFELNHWVKTVI